MGISGVGPQGWRWQRLRWYTCSVAVPQAEAEEGKYPVEAERIAARQGHHRTEGSRGQGLSDGGMWPRNQKLRIAPMLDVAAASGFDYFFARVTRVVCFH
eukprot:5402765-Lingulodinium_polyedra.AAC.1